MTTAVQAPPGVRTRSALILTAATVTALGGLLMGVGATPGSPEYGLALARLASNVLGMAATGFALYGLLWRSPRLAPTGLCWLVATLSVAWLQAAEISPRGLSVTVSETFGYLAHISTGRALLLSGTAVLSYVVVGRLHPAIALVCALAGLVAVPLTGHAAETEPAALGLTAISLHVIAASIWVGGLGAILFLAGTRPDVLADVLPRYSAVAGFCILTCGASGVLLTIQRLAPDGLLSTLTTTGYGVVILGKAACLVAVACTGGYIRQRLLPRIIRHEPTALTTWAGAELAIMTLAVALATALARAPLM